MTKFFCLGDRPETHGILEDFVVLYITEEATTFREAFEEFEAYRAESDEPMVLNMIFRADAEELYEPVQ